MAKRVPCVKVDLVSSRDLPIPGPMPGDAQERLRHMVDDLVDFAHSHGVRLRLVLRIPSGTPDATEEKP